MLQWFAANRDALIAIAALLSPVIAVIGTVVAAFVSYRAVVTGPRIQREIAREQFMLTGRQLDLQERTAVANLLGAADQKWIDDFKETVAELYSVVAEHGQILDARESLGDAHYEVDRSLELSLRFNRLFAKIQLLVPEDKAWAMTFPMQWFTEKEGAGRLQLTLEVFDEVLRRIEQRQAGIAARIAAVERGAKAQV